MSYLKFSGRIIITPLFDSIFTVMDCTVKKLHCMFAIILILRIHFHILVRGKWADSAKNCFCFGFFFQSCCVHKGKSVQMPNMGRSSTYNSLHSKVRVWYWTTLMNILKTILCNIKVYTKITGCFCFLCFFFLFPFKHSANCYSCIMEKQNKIRNKNTTTHRSRISSASFTDT